MDEKKCSRCSVVKGVDEFYRDIKSKNGLRSRCIECCKEIVKQWSEANTERRNAISKKWRNENKDRRRSYGVAYREANKDKVKALTRAWEKANKEYRNDRQRERRAAKRATSKRKKPIFLNKSIAESHSEYMKRVRQSNPSARLNHNTSNAIYKSLKKSKSGRRWEVLVGYTLDELKNHLEKQFKPGMAWDNYGKVWHVDHIIPKSVFNFEAPEHNDFKRCWSLKNLQPLWAKDNLKKHANLKCHFQPSLAI